MLKLKRECGAELFIKNHSNSTTVPATVSRAEYIVTTEVIVNRFGKVYSGYLYESGDLP
jgi:hypothetical protein